MCKIHIAERSNRATLEDLLYEGQEDGRAQEESLKVRLTKTVRDFGGSPYPKGSVLEARIGPDGKLKVVGAQHMPLGFDEWETVLTNEDLERLLNR